MVRTRSSIWRTLPRELVIAVFVELAASSRRLALKLCLVSSSSRRIVLPYVYHTLDLSGTCAKEMIELFEYPRRWFQLQSPLNQVKAACCLPVPRHKTVDEIQLPEMVNLCSNLDTLVISEAYMWYRASIFTHRLQVLTQQPDPLPGLKITIVGGLAPFYNAINKRSQSCIEFLLRFRYPSPISILTTNTYISQSISFVVSGQICDISHSPIIWFRARRI